MMDSDQPILELKGLTVEYLTEDGYSTAVQNVSFAVGSGESLALLGDSGSGKTTIIKALLGLLPHTAKVSGEIVFRGQSIAGPQNSQRLDSLLLENIGFVPQAAMNSLDPVLRIDRQFYLAIRQHRSISRAESNQLTAAALEAVGLDSTLTRSYPHQLSGGMRQRVLIAMAHVLKPELTLADEPTTGLDVVVQAKVLEVLKQQTTRDHALILITHDWDVAASACERVIRLEDGRIILDGDSKELALEHIWNRDYPITDIDTAEPALSLDGVQISYSQGRGLAALRRDNRTEVIKGLDMDLHPGEVLGVFGKSGCGKSTLIGAIAGLVEVQEGRISIRDSSGRTNALSAATVNEHRRYVQMVFQDPFGSLNPRWSVYRTVAEPVIAQKLGGIDGPLGADVDSLISEALIAAELEPQVYADRHPGQLSGGERQRVAIARALVVKPRVIIADEPVSMLDDATARSIMRVFRRLAATQSVAVLLVTHNIHILRECCERVVVMHDGRFVEEGTGRSVVDDPQHEHTQALLNAVPGRTLTRLLN